MVCVVGVFRGCACFGGSRPQFGVGIKRLHRQPYRISKLVRPSRPSDVLTTGGPSSWLKRRAAKHTPPTQHPSVHDVFQDYMLAHLARETEGTTAARPTRCICQYTLGIAAKLCWGGRLAVEPSVQQIPPGAQLLASKGHQSALVATVRRLPETQARRYSAATCSAPCKCWQDGDPAPLSALALKISMLRSLPMPDPKSRRGMRPPRHFDQHHGHV